MKQRLYDIKDLLNKKKNWANIITKPIKIDNGAWVGFNSIILKGVTIGKNAAIAAGSVVIKDVPPNTMVGGNPAKIIKA